MSDIPVISITKECSDEELEDVCKLNINEALTDTEDLIMDQDTVRFRKGSSPVSAVKNTLVDAIKPTMNGSVTDVEDCTDSEEDEGEVKSAREADITLDNFLDQGYVDETTKSQGNDNKPKTLTRCSSKATETSCPATSLQVCSEPVGGALTDCEDLSDEEDSLGKLSIPDCPEDILTRGNENDSSVDIHNAVKRKQEKHFHKQEVVVADESSSESETETPRVRHRKAHRKSDDRPKSDCEDFSMSEDEAAGGACARQPNRQSALFEAEEMMLEGSDVDEEPSHAFPEINITFVADEQENPVVKKVVSRPTALGVETQNPDEGLTDVENLDSSDSEDEKQPTTGKRLMPRAVVRQNKSGGDGGGLTDVEDYNDSDENEDQDNRKEVPHEFLPSPVREIAIVKHDETGEQRQNVMPLNQGLLTVRTPDVEQALTDIEDVSDNEEEGELYDSSKYTLGTLPEIESGDIYSSENPAINPNKLELKSPAQDPVTDTEELFFDRSNSTGCAGTELRRRRKPKQCHAHNTSAAGSFGQYKNKKTLDMKIENTAAATTDVEDMYLSGDDADCDFGHSKQRRATIQFSNLTTPNTECDAAKTDVEFLSGDELPPTDCRMQSPQLFSDGFSSIVKARERNGPNRHSIGSLTGETHCDRIPMIRKISPSPDAHNCHTDSEDIQMISDGEEGESQEQQQQRQQDGSLAMSYSRAQTATPFELTRAMEESGGSCEIHETSAAGRRELLDVKGGCAVIDQPEAHTDVEFLDDDQGGNGV